jgi:hypothetical protein
VEPPSATRWLIRHAMPGGYISWWLLGRLLIIACIECLLPYCLLYLCRRPFSSSGFTLLPFYKVSLKKRIKISIIWLVVVISDARMYTDTHLHMHSTLRGLKLSSPKQPPIDVATRHRMPEEPPGGAGWLHRKRSNIPFLWSGP